MRYSFPYEYIGYRGEAVYRVDDGLLVIDSPDCHVTVRLSPYLWAWEVAGEVASSSCLEWLKVSEACLNGLSEELHEGDSRQMVFPFYDDCISAHHPATLKREEAVVAFLRQLPAAKRRVMPLFASWIWGGVLFLQQGGRAALELCEANPNLVRLLFHEERLTQASNFERGGEIYLKELVNRLPLPQTAFLSVLGFPPERFWIKLLKKTDPELLVFKGPGPFFQGCSPFELRKVLSHLPRVNVMVFMILAKPEAVVYLPRSCLFEIARLERTDGMIPSRVFELERHSKNCWGRLPRPRSVEELERVHERLWEMNRVEIINRYQDVPFPAPPFPGTDLIVPIDTVPGVIQEGREMRHCAHHYVERILKGEWYVYRMVRPERCTILLSKAREDQGWKVSQVRRSCNRLPQIATHLLAEQWLRDTQRACQRTAALSVFDRLGALNAEGLQGDGI